MLQMHKKCIIQTVTKALRHTLNKLEDLQEIATFGILLVAVILLIKPQLSSNELASQNVCLRINKCVFHSSTFKMTLPKQKRVATQKLRSVRNIQREKNSSKLMKPLYSQSWT